MTDSVDLLDAPETADGPAQAELLSPVARIYGTPLDQLPQDLYIPPDALEIMLDASRGRSTCCST
jgi:segregation and condensation protein A